MVIYPVIIGPGRPGHPGFFRSGEAKLLVVGYLGLRNSL